MTFSMVFPGQGAQSVGMLAELAAEHSCVTDCFEEASEVLGYDLWALVQNGPTEELNLTDRTQPAMLSAGVATWRVWQEVGGAMPVAMAGHSLGEYTALVCAEALDFADAIAVIQARGQAMMSAVPAGEGAMAAILGTDDDTIARVCTEVANGQVVTPVNFNSPGQTVIAGHAGAVDRAMAALQEAGARMVKKLPVSAPIHCSLMAPVAEVLQARFADIDVRSPVIPVYHNLDAKTRKQADDIRDALVRHVCEPVRWTDCAQALAATGASLSVECGPGGVLKGLQRRIDRDVKGLAVVDLNSLQAALGATA